MNRTSHRSHKNWARRPAPSSRKWKLRLVQVGLLGILTTLCLVGYQWLPSAMAGLMTIQRVSISGTDRIDRRAILSLLDLPGDRSLLSVDLSELAGKVEAHPGIAAASVGRALPHTLTVIVVERKPAALFQHAGGTFFVDKEGVVFSLGPDRSAGTLPRLTGLPAAKLLGGDPAVRERVRTGLRFAEHLQRRVSRAVTIDLSDARFMVGNTGGLVFWVRNDFQRMWQHYLNLEPSLQARLHREPHEIDLRFAGKVIVRKKG